MHLSSLFLFIVVLIIVLNTLLTSGKAIKTTKTVVPTTTKVLATVKTFATKPVINLKVIKTEKKKLRKKSKKPKQNPWKIPNTEQKKFFNDYKSILRTKITARKLNMTSTYQLQPAKYGSQIVNKNTLHHYLIKLPDSKYAYAIIGATKDIKKGTSINENSVSIRHTL